MTFQTESFDRRRHAVAAFSSGRLELDEWLRHYAGQGQRRDLTRTFVTTDREGAVLGYYTLVATEVLHPAATASVARGASPRFPIPACLLARLAVDQASQGKKLGSLLLLDAFRRVLIASEQIGIRAVVVDAMGDEAAGFYEHFGFERLVSQSHHLQMPLEAIRRRMDDLNTDSASENLG